MEKNKLDKFFAEKLAQREFDFNPAHWEAAEKLIELQEQDNDRKRFGWWFLLIPLLGLLGYLSYFALADEKPNLSESSLKNTGIHLLDSNPEMDINTTSLSNQTTSDNLTTINPEEQTQTSETTKNSTAIETKTPVTDFSTPSTPDNVETKNATAPKAYPESSNRSFPTPVENNTYTTVPKTPATIEASSDVETMIRKGNNSPVVPSEFDDNTILLIVPDSTSGNIKQIKTPKRDQAGIDPKPSSLDQAKKPSVSSSDEAVAIVNTSLLDIPLQDDLDEKGIDPGKGDPLIKNRKKKFDVGLMAGTLFYSTKNADSQDEASSKPNFNVGFKGGLTFGYRFSDHFSLHADALYNWRKEDLGIEDISEDEGYSFGRIATVTERLPQSFHSIEVPLYLQYSLGGHSLEAGISCRHLLAIQGVDKSFGEPDLPEESVPSNDAINTYAVEEVWSPEDKYERFTTSYMLGYRYWFNDRFNLGLRATYTPSAKPFEPEYIDGELKSQTYSTQTNNLNFSLSAKWYFNKRSPYKRI